MAGIDYVEVFLDRPRQLRLPAVKVRDMQIGLADNRGIPASLIEILTRLGGIDLTAYYVAVRVCLMHDDAKLTLTGAEKLVMAHLKKYGNITRLNTALAKLINDTGLISQEQEIETGEDGPGESPAA